MGYLNTRRNAKGHQLELNTSIAEILGEVTASYRLPLGDPRAEWLSFDAGYKYENPEDSRSDQYRLGIKDIRRRGRLWRETRFLDLSVEEFAVGAERDTSTLLVPGMSWTRQDELLPVRPRSASRLAFQVSGTGRFLGSDTDFLQVETSGKVIRPLWRGARVLVRGEVGATLKDELEELPFSVRYFAGGDYSVRGYDYKTLGPTDENGVVIGGSHRFAASVEVDQQVRRNWAVAAFVDAGNAFDTFKDMSLKAGVGLGVRWYSPLGPVRLDVAFPTDDDAPDSFRIHITLGPEL
jgi:translocation and assembly module TamA